MKKPGRLTPSTLSLFVNMVERADADNRVFLNQSALAAIALLSRPTVRAALDELVAARYVRQGKDGSWHLNTMPLLQLHMKPGTDSNE